MSSWEMRTLQDRFALFIIKDMGEADWTEELSDVLFWDVDRKTVNPEKHLCWILERVLEWGDYGDWLVLKKHVPAERMQGTT